MYDMIPRLGAFEVSTVKQDETGKLVDILFFSKLLSSLWPHTRTVRSKVISYLDDLKDRFMTDGELKSKYQTDGKILKQRRKGSQASLHRRGSQGSMYVSGRQSQRSIAQYMKGKGLDKRSHS